MNALKRIVSLAALVVAATAQDATAGISQWASEVIDFRSEFQSCWWAEDALGEPDVFGYGDLCNAWAAAEPNYPYEYLTLGFETPVYATGVTVRETYGNGFVYQIDVVDMAGVLHTVWAGDDPTPRGAPMNFQIELPRTCRLVKGVKIYVDGLSFESWEEIDAVALHGTETPPGDTDGDLVIGILDFLALLAAWGPSPGHPADFNDDDFVGVQDLEILLSNWGGCS